MCGGGDGGVGDGAAVAVGTGDVVGEGMAGLFGGGSGIAGTAIAGDVGFGAPTGAAPGATGFGMDAAKAALPQGAISNANIAKGASLAAPPPLGAILGLIGYSGGWEGEPGTVTSGALGGPGADPRPAWMQGQPTYSGPPAPVAPTTTGPTVIDPSIRSGAYYSVERGRTPEEIDAANRLRMAREQAYAKQRAESEAELLKALGRRDVALTGGLGGRLSETQPASEKFVGTPPVLGQSRHYWA